MLECFYGTVAAAAAIIIMIEQQSYNPLLFAKKTA